MTHPLAQGVRPYARTPTAAYRAPERSADTDRPLRIALLGYRSHPYSGGQGIYLRYLSQALHRLGHGVDVISGPPYPDLPEGVRLIQLPSLDLFENGLGSLQFHHLRSWSNVVEWTSKATGGFAEPYSFGRRAVRYLRTHRHDYDVVHDNQSLSYGMLQLQAMGIPLLSTVHHPITSDLRLALAQCQTPSERFWVRRWHSFLRMQRRVIRRLDHLVTVSERARQDIAREFGIASSRLAVIHNGIDSTLFAPQAHIPRQRCRLLTVASADAPLKGLAVLLDAFAQLLSEHPELTLRVVGRARPGGVTERLCAQLGIEQRVQFVSGLSTEDLVREYAEATLAVVPSLYEGFGLPAGEAMACAVPLISSDGGALPEVVGDAGCLVPAGDSRALAAAIDQLLKDASRREVLGRLGRQRVQSHFTWERAALQLTQRYQQLVRHADG